MHGAAHLEAESRPDQERRQQHRRRAEPELEEQETGQRQEDHEGREFHSRGEAGPRRPCTPRQEEGRDDEDRDRIAQPPGAPRQIDRGRTDDPGGDEAHDADGRADRRCGDASEESESEDVRQAVELGTEARDLSQRPGRENRLACVARGDRQGDGNRRAVPEIRREGRRRDGGPHAEAPEEHGREGDATRRPNERRELADRVESEPHPRKKQVGGGEADAAHRVPTRPGCEVSKGSVGLVDRFHEACRAARPRRRGTILDPGATLARRWLREAAKLAGIRNGARTAEARASSPRDHDPQGDRRDRPGLGRRPDPSGNLPAPAGFAAGPGARSGRPPPRAARPFPKARGGARGLPDPRGRRGCPGVRPPPARNASHDARAELPALSRAGGAPDVRGLSRPRARGAADHGSAVFAGSRRVAQEAAGVGSRRGHRRGRRRGPVRPRDLSPPRRKARLRLAARLRPAAAPEQDGGDAAGDLRCRDGVRSRSIPDFRPLRCLHARRAGRSSCSGRAAARPARGDLRRRSRSRRPRLDDPGGAARDDGVALRGVRRRRFVPDCITCSRIP